MNDTQLEALRYMATHGTCTVRDVMRDRQMAGTLARDAVRGLVAHGYAYAFGLDLDSKRLYEITGAGRLALRKIDNPESMGDMPTPRLPYPTETYKPVHVAPVRPGAERAFVLPSRVNGERVERSRPSLRR